MQQINMRDEYNRITPDFDAWEKLGYICTEIHEHTYTLGRKDEMDDYLDFTQIYAGYETDLTDSGKPEYYKEHFDFPNSELVPFTEEELKQIEADIKNWEEEIKKENK